MLGKQQLSHCFIYCVVCSVSAQQFALEDEMVGRKRSLIYFFPYPPGISDVKIKILFSTADRASENTFVF